MSKFHTMTQKQFDRAIIRVSREEKFDYGQWSLMSIGIYAYLTEFRKDFIRGLRLKKIVCADDKYAHNVEVLESVLSLEQWGHVEICLEEEETNKDQFIRAENPMSVKFSDCPKGAMIFEGIQETIVN